MLLANFLWTLIFTTTAAIATLQTSPPDPHPQSLLLARMERLEQQQQQWENEKQTLRDDLHLLQSEKQDMRAEIEALYNEKHTFREDLLLLQMEKQDMRAEIEALQNEKQTFKENLRHEMKAEMANANTLTQTLAAENQDLKSQLGHLQRQMVSIDMQVTSLRHQVAQCGDNAVSPDIAGGKDTGDQHSPRESRPIPPFSDPDHEERHVQSARSDDQGPLQVVVDHLAATTTQLTSDLQALTSQHASDVQALKSQHTSDVQALTSQHASDVQALTSQHASDVQALKSQHSSDVQTLRTQITAVQAAQGSTFVQWGSSTCSGSSDIIYSGAVGGSFYTHTGAAANALCLSLSPTLVDKSPSYYTVLYGAEYETYDSHMNADSLCAVCRSHHSSTVMVPGTNVCASGWSLMYSGYLMAGSYGHAAATEFICVDSKLEGAMGSNRNDDDGHLLYYTEALCGSLPCPPYENNKCVTCAVCSK